MGEGASAPPGERGSRVSSALMLYGPSSALSLIPSPLPLTLHPLSACLRGDAIASQVATVALLGDVKRRGSAGPMLFRSREPAGPQH
eukprot:3878703-Pyramimonas_sp.AAC.1